MKRTLILKTLIAFLATGLLSNSHANSVGFDQSGYTYAPVITVNLIYDFTDFAMFGGSVAIEYDPGELQFIGFTQGPLSPDAQAQASPIGSLVGPGVYSNVGIGTFDFLNPMTSAGTIGAFTFAVIGGGNSGTTSCGLSLCILPFIFNPFISEAGSDVTDELIENGISGALISLPVPVPAAMWLMLSGLLCLAKFGRTSGTHSRH